MVFHTKFKKSSSLIENKIYPTPNRANPIYLKSLYSRNYYEGWFQPLEKLNKFIEVPKQQRFTKYSFEDLGWLTYFNLVELHSYNIHCILDGGRIYYKLNKKKLQLYDVNQEENKYYYRIIS